MFIAHLMNLWVLFTGSVLATQFFGHTVAMREESSHPCSVAAVLLRCSDVRGGAEKSQL